MLHCGWDEDADIDVRYVGKDIFDLMRLDLFHWIVDCVHVSIHMVHKSFNCIYFSIFRTYCSCQ